MTQQHYQAVSLATFVPNTAPITLADYAARQIVSTEIFSALTIAGLLPCGLIGLDCCEAGVLRDGLMRFEVRDRIHALEAIQYALGMAKISHGQYELASRTGDVLASYETAWLPDGRASVLHGLTDREL